jgi:hypothetical protein
VSFEVLPFKGRIQEGMGTYRQKPIPTPALPLKGRELISE